MLSQSIFGGDCCLADKDFTSVQEAVEWAEEKWNVPSDQWIMDGDDFEWEDEKRDVSASITKH
jgi:hypothetical protein